MDFKEKKLYHQIHPAKLFVDWGGTGIVALYFLWLHKVVIAIIVMFLPAFIASFVIIQFVPLEKYKQSSFGIVIGIIIFAWIHGVTFSNR